MWSSIEKIIFPESLDHAVTLIENGAEFFAGGTYLVADRDSSIHTLIDINKLISNDITVSYGGVEIGAGADLQKFIDTAVSVNPDCRLIKAAKWSCSSKNIRNQRTMGGEIAKRRINSEVMVFLLVVNADLTIFTDKEKTISIRDWNGKGIITKISYYPARLESVEIQRYSVIPSAPAVVIAAGVRKGNMLTFTVGGKAIDFSRFVLPIKKYEENRLENFATKAAGNFFNDHYGSVDYKRHLIYTALKRMKEKL